MLTEFGRILRKIRIDYGEIIKDMATKLGVTASYLSAVETGKRSIPQNWIEVIVKAYNLSNEQHNELKQASADCLKSLTIDIDGVLGTRRETAILFAREFETVDDSTMEKIKDILKNSEKGE